MLALEGVDGSEVDVDIGQGEVDGRVAHGLCDVGCGRYLELTVEEVARIADT